MNYTTLNISMPTSLKAQIEDEVASGKFASSSDFIRDLVRGYLEYKRIEGLVAVGLEDKNVSSLRKSDFEQIKRDLVSSVQNAK